MVVIVFALLAAAIVVAIALITVGRITGEFVDAAPTSIYDLDEAVEFVAERIPEEATAQLTFDEVRSMLTWHLEYLEERGVARRQGVNDLAAGPLVAAEDDALAHVLGRASEAGLELDDVWVVQVLDADTAYLEAIGAIGPQVPMPPDPSGPDPEPSPS
ncbi:MAG: hypothetical protein KGR18_03275 [Acidobacteria bacterium]|nr:hypothetical protein [Acidobacteriota bacterium]